MLMTTILCEAQETLITTDGEVMMVYIDDIGSTTIYYKTVDSANSQLQRIDKSKVYMIKRADGTKYDLGNTQTPVPAQQASTPAQPMNKELSDEAKQRNKELIDALNKAAALPEHKEPKDKNAVGVYATLGLDENSIVCNDDIELSYTAKGNNFANCHDVVLTIKNTTNNTVFVDLANTFLISNGESSPYYVPTAYSSSKSKTGDANAGTFAGAMGIHDYQTNVSTSTVYSQRVISIPPMSQKTLNTKSLFPPCSLIRPGVYVNCNNNHILKFYFGEECALKQGETFSFTQENSPLKWSFFVTYSYKEDCEVTNSVSLNIFMKKVIGYGNKWKGGWIGEIIDYASAENIVGYVYDKEIQGTVLKRP